MHCQNTEKNLSIEDTFTPLQKEKTRLEELRTCTCVNLHNIDVKWIQTSDFAGMSTKQ